MLHIKQVFAPASAVWSVSVGENGPGPMVTPDTAISYMYDGCSEEMLRPVVFAVNWKTFAVWTSVTFTI